ncbi:393_t:CDS:2 [Funneliformis mosseae]|uniref:393_t:CDS:1 n=1 Tax=Funneliformis mosseae TaxID=27381 RepID=A0A9N9A4T4_FUNMO|nr:393_t:CDS:2 [Funneliformis mosseae]
MSQYSHVPLITVGYQCLKNELEDIFKENIKIKQVIANQPITKGGSQLR